MLRRKFLTAIAALVAAPALAKVPKVPTLVDPRGPAPKGLKYVYPPRYYLEVDEFKETMWPGIREWYEGQYNERT
jgi:hypothetical protein